MRLSDRLQYHAARWLAHLPDGVLQWLTRDPPPVADGIRLDPHAHLLQSFRRRRHGQGLVRPDVHAGRRRYRRDTEAFRGPVTPVGEVRDFAIGELPVRHYRAPGPSRDLTVYLHGGGFAIGDLDTHDEPCRILCREANVDVLSVGYRLAPEHPFPAAVEDAEAALRWALAHHERVSIGGDSAGANLATVAGRAALAQLLIYPVTDSTSHRRSYELFGEGHFLTLADRADFSALYTGGTGVPGSDPRISPLLDPDLSGRPPALVVTACFDLLRDEGEAYAEALRAAGNVAVMRRVGSLGHGFIHLTGICRAARAATVEIARDWRRLLDAC